MKTFKEWTWIPTAAKVAWDVGKNVVPQLIKRVNPATVGVPVQTGITLGNKLRNKYNKRKVMGVKAPKKNTNLMKNEMMTAGDAGIPQDTKNMGPRKKGKRFTTQNFDDRRKRKDNPFPLLRRFNTWNNGNG